MTIDQQEIDAFKASEEYQALGVIGRWRLMCERFPEVEERHRARTARHLERALLSRPLTPDPDRPEEAT